MASILVLQQLPRNHQAAGFFLVSRSTQQIGFDLGHRAPYHTWRAIMANMDMIPLKPERKAQLEEYAKRRGQDPASALDDALATYLEWERQDFAETVDGIRHGYEDVRAG